MLRIVKKFSLLMDKQQKRSVVGLVFLMIVCAVFETLSVSVVVPLMTALMQENFIESNELAKTICGVLHINDDQTFVFAAIIALICLFILKDVFLSVEYYIQVCFVCESRVKIQKKLMETYLSRPYEFFINASSGEILRIVRSDTGGAFGLLMTVMTFFAELIVASALIIGVIVIDPLMAFIVALLLVFVMLLIYKVIKPVLRKAGVGVQENNAFANKWLLQSIAGVKEMKVANKEEFFVNKYNYYAKKGVECEKKSIVLGNIPRQIIEAVTVSGMLGYIAVMVYNGKPVSELLPQISAFAVAAARLLPSANRISAALNTIPYSEPQLDKTIENLRIAESMDMDERYIKTQNNESNAKITLSKECGLKNITFSYPNSEKNVLNNADMVIPIGKSIGIIGPSGAGKTTAVDILLGLLQPQDGTVYSDEVNIEDDYCGWLKHVSYIPQMIYMLDDTIRANVAFGCNAEEVNDEMVWKALDEAQMGDYVRSLPEGIETVIGERGVRLSGGQRQRIGIARALYTEPELLIFDEATSALDNETEEMIMESINSLHGKKTIIIIAHRLTTIRECDLVYNVQDGKINSVNQDKI